MARYVAVLGDQVLDGDTVALQLALGELGERSEAALGEYRRASPSSAKVTALFAGDPPR
jgi:hypothetical protein